MRSTAKPLCGKASRHPPPTHESSETVRPQSRHVTESRCGGANGARAEGDRVSTSWIMATRNHHGDAPRKTPSHTETCSSDVVPCKLRRASTRVSFHARGTLPRCGERLRRLTYAAGLTALPPSPLLHSPLPSRPSPGSSSCTAAPPNAGSRVWPRAHGRAGTTRHRRPRRLLRRPLPSRPPRHDSLIRRLDRGRAAFEPTFSAGAAPSPCRPGAGRDATALG